MVIRWPAGLVGGRLLGDLVHFTDWLPTLLAMTGADRPGGMPLDGGNVLPLLRGDSSLEAPKRFWQWNGYSPIGACNAAMRDGPW